MGRTDGRTLDSCTDPDPHTMRAVPPPKKKSRGHTSVLLPRVPRTLVTPLAAAAAAVATAGSWPVL